MSLTNYFLNDFAAFGRFLDEAFNSYAHLQLRNGNQAVGAFRPRLDVHHDKYTNTVSVSFDLPGLQKEDVEIEMCTTTYRPCPESVRETRSAAASERSEEGYMVPGERRYGRFGRSVSPGSPPKQERITVNESRSW